MKKIADVSVNALLIFVFATFLSVAACGQSLSFTYQGSLTSGGNAANGNFDFEFALFTAISAGSQVGSTQLANGVLVTNGTFSVALNFGDQYPGANRFLEIRVRPQGGGAFTTLTPRQQVQSTPYAIRSLNSDTAISATSASIASNATQLGGIAASQYVVTTDPRMSDARQPVAGNSNYVQNRTTVQTGTNFNISGVGNAGVFNAATQFNLNGSRILGTGTGTANTFGGINAGANASNLSDDNTFFGNSAGQTMVTAVGNSFFGFQAGQSTTSGTNTFIGSLSGRANTSGSSNSFLGYGSGDSNTTGNNNSFFGRSAGSANQTGSGNSFFGYQAGETANTSNNSFFGFQSGRLATGINNSFFGWSSGVATTTGTNNSFFGVQSGLNNTTGIDNAYFGRDSGRDNISGSGNSFFGRNAGLLTRSDSNTFIGLNAGNTNFAGNNNTAIGANADVASAALDFATAIGAGAVVDSDNTVVIGRTSDTVEFKGTVKVRGFSHKLIFADGFWTDSPAELGHACVNDGAIGSYIAFCASSIRFKDHVKTISDGLKVVSRLRPVSFAWKSSGRPAIGLIAEEVAEVEPILAVRGSDGVINSVNFDGVTAVLVSAMKQQQAQIEKLQKQVEAITVENRRFKVQLKSLRLRSGRAGKRKV